MSDRLEQDDRFMRRAMALAREAARDPQRSPIGCVIVRDGQIIAEGTNEVGTENDPTAHAEIVSIRRAGQALGSPDLQGATLYTTLQPCGMCTMAMIWAKIGRVAFGAGREHVHRMYFEDRHLDTIDFIKDAFRDDLAITPGVLADICRTLYFQPGDEVPESQQGNI